jgi:Uncharacterised protein family (UPF0158)
MMFQLVNGKPIDEFMVEAAMDDANRGNLYFLNTETGEVLFLSELDAFTEERDQELEEIDGSDIYIPIERIDSSEAYRWMEDFVAQIVAPRSIRVAEKLSIALMGRGAFRRFKDVLHMVGDDWAQAWYDWRDRRLKEAMYEWLESLSGIVTKVEKR